VLGLGGQQGVKEPAVEVAQRQHAARVDEELFAAEEVRQRQLQYGVE
jgi:hypothetical protein